MGKIKRERQKFHIVADSKDVAIKKPSEAPKYKPLKLDAVENIFAGIKIQLDDIKKFEEEPTSEAVLNAAETIESEVPKSTVGSSLQKIDIGSKQEKHLTKKEKLALKHQKLMEKLDVTQHAILKAQKKRNPKTKEQTLLPKKSEVRSMLTLSAIKPSGQSNAGKAPKNIFSIPVFNDDLPSLNSVMKLKLNQNNNTEKVSKKSKNIAKTANTKKNFVSNYNFLKNAMKNVKTRK